MSRYLFASHDGYGLGHTRRNAVVARAVSEADPDARITLVSGIASGMWDAQEPSGARVVHVPPLLKSGDGSYRASGRSFDQAINARVRIFREEVERLVPNVVIVDRHPYGTAGELRRGLEAAKSMGAVLVLGLRDILDEPDAVISEMAGAGWDGVEALFDAAFVYGSRRLCDHEAEYGLPLPPTYCGWVTERAARMGHDPRLVVIAAGGGGDGADVFRLGAELLALRPRWRGIVAAGPYAGDVEAIRRLAPRPERLDVRRDVTTCSSLFAVAGSTIQMAGYNTTFEALGAGLRPILVPRRSPRREQAIRATRLAALGLADVVDEHAPAAEVDWLLNQPRLLPRGALERAGIDLDGARHAAAILVDLARTGAFI